MGSEYVNRRKEIEARFSWHRRIREAKKIERSPSGNFELTIDSYKTGNSSWAYTRGRVRQLGRRDVIADVKRNFSHFWFCWVNHSNGNEYLLCGEDYQGQTVVNLSARQIHSYFPDAGYSGFGFCWVQAFPSHDSSVLAVNGCVWAGPYEVVFFDFNQPDVLPYKELYRVLNSGECQGWNGDRFELTQEIEVRKSDGHPYDELGDSEQDELDERPGSTEYIQGSVSVSLKDLWGHA